MSLLGKPWILHYYVVCYPVNPDGCWQDGGTLHWNPWCCGRSGARRM